MKRVNGCIWALILRPPCLCTSLGITFAESIRMSEQIPIKRHRLEQVETFEVSGDELERIEREASSVGTYLQYALFWLPVGISLTATLSLTTISSNRVYISFFVVMVMSYAFGLFFLVRWYQTRDVFKELIRKIRDRQVGPVGEEGKELKPADLAELPSTEPPKENQQ